MEDTQSLISPWLLKDLLYEEILSMDNKRLSSYLLVIVDSGKKEVFDLTKDTIKKIFCDEMSAFIQNKKSLRLINNIDDVVDYAMQRLENELTIAIKQKNC